MSDVPNFIVGVGRLALFKMAGEYVQKGVQSETNSEVRQMILEQMHVQAKYYKDLLLSKGFTAESEKYERVEKDTQELLSKSNIAINSKVVDEVHQAIMGYCLKRK